MMPAKPLISCPHCDARFRAKDRSVLGRKTRCPKSREPFVAEECEPEALAEEDESPLRMPPRAHQAKTGTRRKPLSKRTVRLLVRWSVIAGVIVAAAIGVLAVDWKGTLNKTGLFTDTPEKLAAALQRCRSEADATLASGGNDKVTAAKLNAAEQELSELLIRVSRLEPIPDQQYDELLQRYPGAFANASGGGDALAGAVQGLTRSPAAGPTDPRQRRADQKVRSQLGLSPDQQYRVKETHDVRDPFGKVMGQWVVVEHESQSAAAARRGSQTRAAVGKLLGAISTLALKSSESSATNALRFGLRRIPEPRGKFEELEADVVNLVRSLNRRLANVASAQEFEALAPELDSAAARVRRTPTGEESDQSLIEQQQFAVELYRPYAVQSCLQMRALVNFLEGRYQPRPAFRKALSNLQAALPDQTLAANLVPARKLADEKPATPMGFGAESPLTPFGGAPSPPPGDSGANLADMMHQMIDQFVERHGREKVLLLKITGSLLPGTERTLYLMRLQKLTGPSADSVAFGLPGAVWIGVLYTGDIEALAKRIDFGKVLEIDTAGRTITVGVDTK